MRTVMFLVVLTILISPAHAYKVSGWDVKPISDRKGFIGCIMTGDFQGGTRVGVLVLNNYTWAVTFAHNSWQNKNLDNIRVDLYIDRVKTATGTTYQFAPGIIAIPLTGAKPYQALQAGNKLSIVSGLGGQSAFSLKGTRRAMNAVLTCVERNRGKGQLFANQGNPTTPKSNSTANSQQSSGGKIPYERALVMTTNFLSKTGEQGYEIQPRASKKDNIVDVKFGNGDYGLFQWDIAGKVTAEIYIQELISLIGKKCKGEVFTGKKSIPTADGSMIREAKVQCRDSNRTRISHLTAITQPNGLLLAIQRDQILSSLQEPETSEEIERFNKSLRSQGASIQR